MCHTPSSLSPPPPTHLQCDILYEHVRAHSKWNCAPLCTLNVEETDGPGKGTRPALKSVARVGVLCAGKDGETAEICGYGPSSEDTLRGENPPASG